MVNSVLNFMLLIIQGSQLWSHFSFEHKLVKEEFNCLRTHWNCRAMNHYTAIWWLVHWPLMGGLLHLVQWWQAWAGCGSTQSPHCCTKCNSPPINGQCTNFILFHVALFCLCTLKGRVLTNYWQNEIPQVLQIFQTL